MRRRKSGAPGQAPGCCWGCWRASSSWQASSSATSSALESSSVSWPSSLTKEEIVRRSKMRRGKSEHLLDLRADGGVEREHLVERGRVQLGRRLRERIRRRKSGAPGCWLETTAVLEMEEHRGSERG